MSEAEEAKNVQEGEEEEDEVAVVKEEESTAVFEPVVVLDEVETQTGEEEEEVLYSQRAKLFVFGETLLDVGTGNKSWKERGIGNLRLLRHKEHSKIRVLMRQEKTHKLLVNHVLLPGLVLLPHTTSDKSLVWRAEDFADGESLVLTDFCVRFASSEIATAFKEKFEEHQREMVALYAGLDAGDQAGGDEAAEALQSLNVAAAADGDTGPEEKEAAAAVASAE